MCELAKRIDLDVTLDFMSISSYRFRHGFQRCREDHQGSDEPRRARMVIMWRKLWTRAAHFHYLMEIPPENVIREPELCTPCWTAGET